MRRVIWKAAILYFALMGLMVHVVPMAVGVGYFVRLDVPLHIALGRVERRLSGHDQLSGFAPVIGLLRRVAQPSRPPVDRSSLVARAQLMAGAQRTLADGSRQQYGPEDRPLPRPPASERLPLIGKRTVEVRTPGQLKRAIEEPAAGDVIELLPGRYRLSGSVRLRRGGTAAEPIYVRAAALGDVTVELDALEGFHVLGPYWVFENLEIRGVCASHDDCEHAFHVVGDARGTVIRNNVIRDFNAAIKANGENVGGGRRFPDGLLVEHNTIYNESVRQTSNPVVPVDVIGADFVQVRGNLIADFYKARGDNISYAGYIKGNAREGLFEANLVVCKMRLVERGFIQVGLSLGGGGTFGAACRDRDCTLEHTGGTLRNNIIMHCPDDVGIYLNRAKDTLILHNTLYNTLGIDVRFPASDAVIAANVLDGRIRERDGGIARTGENLSAASPRSLHSLFRSIGEADFALERLDAVVDRAGLHPSAEKDFCGSVRGDGRADLGAIEYGSWNRCRFF